MLFIGLGQLAAAAEQVGTRPPPISPEPLNRTETLATPYPDHWILALDSSFMHMAEGQVVVLDPLAKTLSEQYKGMYTAAGMAAIAQSTERGEHYVAETFHSRAGRGGERTDTVTIYDPATLSVIEEIIIPPKRVAAMPKRIAMTLTNDQRFLLVYNFTPAQSVSVVDLETRTFVGEVDIAGCAFVIPTGKRGFSSLCSNGSLLSMQLTRKGAAGKTTRTEPVIDINADPVFEAYGQSGDTGYFPTFTGNLLPVRLSGRTAQPQNSWSLVDQQQREQGWRPGGVIPIAADGDGLLYVLMHPDGTDGTHKNGGSEVWVVDPQSKSLSRRIELKNWGISLGMTGTSSQPLLTVVNTDFVIDIYNARTGDLLSSTLTSLDTVFRVDAAN